ncbi:hypothetical protein K8I85_04590 [bacterium]|nr:hypothetical protein [bacterium]
MPMLRRNDWLVGCLLLVALPLVACSGQASHAKQDVHPAKVEHIDGSDLSKVTLTERAVERTGVLTASVTEERGRTVVPYSSIIYDAEGNTWVYTSPEPRTFVRAAIVVDRIDGDNVYLTDGPPVGTMVASQGVAEIYGTEFAVGH